MPMARGRGVRGAPMGRGDFGKYLTRVKTVQKPLLPALNGVRFNFERLFNRCRLALAMGRPILGSCRKQWPLGWWNRWCLERCCRSGWMEFSVQDCSRTGSGASLDLERNWKNGLQHRWQQRLEAYRTTARQTKVFGQILDQVLSQTIWKTIFSL